MSHKVVVSRGKKPLIMSLSDEGGTVVAQDKEGVRLGLAYYSVREKGAIEIDSLINCTLKDYFAAKVNGVGTALMDYLETKYVVHLTSLISARAFYERRHMKNCGPDYGPRFESTDLSREDARIRMEEQALLVDDFCSRTMSETALKGAG